MVTTIIKWILSMLVKVGLRKKDEADASRVKAVEKTLDGVKESLDVEKDIRDAQDKVDENPSDVEDKDGGLNFDDFNSGEDK